MKKILLNMLLVCIFLLAASIVTLGAEIELYAPAEDEIAPGRDFYIVGSIDRNGKSADAEPLNIKIELVDAKGKVVRSLQSNVGPNGVTSASYFLTDYDAGSAYNDEKGTNILQFTPPDIMYDGNERDSVRSSNVKIVVKENYFAAIVFGGATKDFDLKYEDVNGEPLVDITKGKYALKISAIDFSDNLVASYEKEINFSDKSPRLLASSNVGKFAVDNDFVLPNSIVGRWRIGDYIDVNSRDFSYTVPLRLISNTKAEFTSSGEAAILLNNLNFSDNSMRFAFGSIFDKDASVEKTYLYYDIGEKEITYDFAGSKLVKKGNIVIADKERFIMPLRAETASDTSGYFDFDFTDGLSLTEGNNTVIYGVYSPVVSNAVFSNGTYKITNSVSDIKAIIYDEDDKIVYESSAAAFLTKADDTTAQFEFALDIIPDEIIAGNNMRLVIYACNKEGKELLKSDEISVSVLGKGDFISGYKDTYWGKDFCDTVNFLGVTASGDPLTPDEHIKRGDFAAMVNRILGFSATGDSKFEDLEEDDVFYTDCVTAQNTGYMTGDHKGFVKAEDYISREQAIIILARISKATAGGEVKTFEDSDEISFWAKDYVDAMCTTGIISGFNGYLKPTDNITVAEAAALIIKTVKWMNADEDTVINVDIVVDKNDDYDISSVDFENIKFMANPTEEDIVKFFEVNTDVFKYVKSYLEKNCPNGAFVGKVGNELEIRDYKMGDMIHFEAETVDVITKTAALFASFTIKYNPSRENAIHFSFGNNENKKEHGITYTVLDEVKNKELTLVDGNWYYYVQK